MSKAIDTPALRFYLPPSPGYIPCAHGHVFLVGSTGSPTEGAPCLCGQRTYGTVKIDRTVARRSGERWQRWVLVALGVVLSIVLALRW